MNKKQRISIVSYTNTLPFRWALKKSTLLDEIELFEDIPSICAQKLKYGQVDLALVPVALLPELPSFFIESDYCIGADGKVDSVKLYSNVPLSEITAIHLDYQSKTSVTLTRVLCKFFWKQEVAFKDAMPGFETAVKPGEANVVIGDRTFLLDGRFFYEYDLAEEWKKFTGLPFVFAAWVSREKLPADFMQKFNSVLAEGVKNIRSAVEAHPEPLPLSPERAIRYLSDSIKYDLDEEKMKAMNLFFGYISRL